MDAFAAALLLIIFLCVPFSKGPLGSIIVLQP
jgi:hypothetical protein